MKRSSVSTTRSKAVWGSGRTVAALALLTFSLGAPAFAAPGHVQHPPTAAPGVPSQRVKNYRFDDEITKRAKSGNPLGITSAIVTLQPGASLPADLRKYARPDRLDIINSVVLDMPNQLLKKLDNAAIYQVHFNRPIKAHNYRTRVTVGADIVQNYIGYTGAGIGIAVIDSGIATWHDDLTNNTSKVYPYGNQRVSKFVDFVNGRALPYDDNGHGTHVAGILAGNGYDSRGEKAGIAPGASIVSLKVLDANGQGTISNIIGALNWIAANYRTYNIRVVNMSIGAGVYESYWTDPLTLAAKAVTDKGITIVAAAGNLGKNALGQLQYGAITAPGNAPWVLTVGASSTMGTLSRADDTMAGYSSSGPTYIDYTAKPDLVAPGTGTISLSAPGSTFYANDPAFLVSGLLSLGTKPYLTLSGTSMAAPVVSGTVALMLQANPNLTPNLIKAILQYTAQIYPGYSPLRQGAGFLNTLGAVGLSMYYAGTLGHTMPDQPIWSHQIIWGNHRLSGGAIKSTANAWATNIVWGTALTGGTTGFNIVWGTARGDDNIVWGTANGDDNIVWGTADGDDNIVWGTDCGGADCDLVVWGSASGDDNIVWGTATGDDNIVWGTAAGDDNIVWGTSVSGDFSWASDADESTVFPPEDSEPLPSIELQFGNLPLPTTTTTTTTTTTITTTTTQILSIGGL
jgi:serine protease AprX